MGDKGGKKDKEKNKQQQLTETERRGAEEARQRPGQKTLSRNSVKPILVRWRTGLINRFAAQGSATAGAMTVFASGQLYGRVGPR